MQQWRSRRLLEREIVHNWYSAGSHLLGAHRSWYYCPIARPTTLANARIDIQGTITFTKDTDYWQAHAFKQVFQNATTFFQLGGTDVNVYGGGTLDGNGQVWYDLYAKDIYILRPILFGTVGLKGGRIEDLNLRYSPQWYNFVANSSDVVFSNLTISGASKSSNVAKNTDGYVWCTILRHTTDMQKLGYVSFFEHCHPKFAH